MEAPASPTPLTQRRRESRSPESALKPRSWHTYYIQSSRPIWTNFCTPGWQLRRRSISVFVILITQNLVQHIWHHIHLLTSPFFDHLHLETSHRPFHIIIWLTLNIENTSVSYEIYGSTPRTTRSRSPVRPAEIPGALRQSEGLLLAWISDVIHHLMRCHDNTSAITFYK